MVKNNIDDLKSNTSKTTDNTDKDSEMTQEKKMSTSSSSNNSDNHSSLKQKITNKAIGKTKVGEQAAKIKETAQTLTKIGAKFAHVLSTVGTGVITALTNPATWLVMFLLIGGLASVSTGQTLGQSDFGSACASDSASADGAGGADGIGGNVTKNKWTLEQVTKFSKFSYSSDFGVSDSKAEKMYLSSGTHSIQKYGLNASNIGKVTAAIKKTGVSPVFFYSYAMSEGAGFAGYINHFPSETETGDPVKEAIKDSEYIVEYSNRDAPPAYTADMYPVVGTNMDTSDVAAWMKKMPYGSIGKVYAAATGATTIEIKNLLGHKTPSIWGNPLQNVMDNVKAMGGNPLKGKKAFATKPGGGSSAGSGNMTETDAECLGDSGELSSDGAKMGIQIAWKKRGEHQPIDGGKGQSNAAYIKAKEQAEKNGGKDSLEDLFASCDRVLATILKSTGIDKDIPWGAARQQRDYLLSSSKWKQVSCQDRKPGMPMAQTDGDHVMYYVGKVDGKEMIVSGSFAPNTPASRTAELGPFPGCDGAKWKSENPGKYAYGFSVKK